MKAIIHPTYFPSIAHFIVLTQNQAIFETEDNYQKQTFRNRSHIYGANGKQTLSIPVKHTKTIKRQKYKDVKIENDFAWQRQHWKSIETAYRSTPFFEFYEDDLCPLFEKPEKWLLEFNLKTIQILARLLAIEVPKTNTKNYQKTYESENYKDFRSLVNAKKQQLFPFENYTQVFTTKFGFLNDLSGLDLLFNQGPTAQDYLSTQKLKWK